MGFMKYAKKVQRKLSLDGHKKLLPMSLFVMALAHIYLSIFFVATFSLSLFWVVVLAVTAFCVNTWMVVKNLGVKSRSEKMIYIFWWIIGALVSLVEVYLYNRFVVSQSNSFFTSKKATDRSKIELKKAIPYSLFSWIFVIVFTLLHLATIFRDLLIELDESPFGVKFKNETRDDMPRIKLEDYKNA